MQTDQNNKFAISLQYCKKYINEEVDFLLVDTHESMLQIDTMVLMEMVKHSQVPKKQVCNVFSIPQKRS